MLEENKIVIISDDGSTIKFKDVTTIFDDVNRQEVESIECEVLELEAQRSDLENRLADLKLKLAYAKRIIAIADENSNTVVDDNDETKSSDSEE